MYYQIYRLLTHFSCALCLLLVFFFFFFAPAISVGVNCFGCFLLLLSLSFLSFANYILQSGRLLDVVPCMPRSASTFCSMIGQNKSESEPEMYTDDALIDNKPCNSVDYALAG